MATEEIAEGIRKSEFAKLEKFIASKISSWMNLNLSEWFEGNWL
jgi:hypothetical protein